MIVVHAKPKIEAWEWQPDMVTIPERVVGSSYWKNDTDHCIRQPLFRRVEIRCADDNYLCDYCHHPMSEHAVLPDHVAVCPGEFIVREEDRTFAIPEELFHVQYEEV